MLSPDEEARALELKEKLRKAFPNLATPEFVWLLQQVKAQRLHSNELRTPVLAQILKSRYVREPVPVKEFIVGREYLGLPIGSGGIYPKIADDLELLFDDFYSEVILAGSIGWGKTTFATLAIAYELYRLSCLRDPATAYGMKRGSNMTFVNVSVHKKQAERVFFTDLYNLVKESYYFNCVFKYDRSLQTEIRFPKNVRCYSVAASEEAALGDGVFSAFIDEVNYMEVIEDSKRSTPGSKNVYDQAEVVYNKLRARMRSRMNLCGRLAGHIYACSSARYPNDFTERLCQQANREAELGMKNMLVLLHALWETLPEGRIGPGRFKVERGDKGRNTRILTGNETDIVPSLVIEVPEDYRRDFEYDPDMALRDLAGYSVLSVRPFLSRREQVKKMFEMAAAQNIQNAFSVPEATLQDTDDPYRERLVPENLHCIEEPRKNSMGLPLIHNGKVLMEKKLFPALYYAHVDLAKNHDAAGICIVHPVEATKVTRFNAHEKQDVEESKPIIRVDLLLRVVAPKQAGGEIDIPRIRAIIYELHRRCQMQFGKITFDTFGSQETIKTLKDEGFDADLLSLDKDMTPYEIARLAIYDERVLCPYNEVLERELVQLERGDKKIDHPATHGASKDLADAFAGAIYNCEAGWSAGEQSRGLFQIGEVQYAGEPSPEVKQKKEAILTKVVEGKPISDLDENIILFGDLEKL